MKIVCESCGAKYSIADEKVAGKVFKIRCKKCSAVIVVKGDTPEGDESTRVYDYGGEAIWHVVVAGEQQGPFAPRQIGELLADGKIDWEAYVWREGMDGWQPAKDVEALVSAVMSDSEGAKGPKAATYGSGQVFGGSSDMGADPFAAADDGGLGSVIAQPAKSSAGVKDDLFAKSARSPFSGAAEEEERASSSGRIANARVGGEALTGQRNENSVLFSLTNLQALATGSGGATGAAVSSRPGMATGEGSGLIDIRALASATQAVADRPNGSAREKVEDLLAVGAGSAGFSAVNFAAPVAVEKADTNKLLVGGMIAAFVAILGLGGAVAYLVMREPQAAPTATAGLTQPGPAAEQAGGPAAQAAAAPTATAERERPAAEPGAAGREPEPESPREAKSASGGGHAAPKKGRESGGGKEKEAPAAAAPAPAPAPAPAAPKKSSGDQSIDDLLSGALGAKSGGGAKPAPAAKPAAADLPSSPSRDDVLGALKAVSPKVAACGNGQSGIATAKIGVTGSTGRVTSVDVSGQFAGTPVAACVSREVGKAKFPKFSQPSFSVTFPFKI